MYYHLSPFEPHILNKHNAVERPDFGAEVTDNLLMGTHLGPLVKHANWALKLINALPESFSGRWIPGQPHIVPVFDLVELSVIDTSPRLVRLLEDEE